MVVVQNDGLALEFASDELKNDKEIVLLAISQYGEALYYASDELRNDKEIVMAAIKQDGEVLEYASNELRKDKEFILQVVAISTYACKYSLLEGYKNFNEVVEKEGEEFLFSCWNNKEAKTRLQVANHPNFLPTEEQIEVGLKDQRVGVKEVYQLRKEEWMAKMEENKLRNNL